MNLYKDFNPNFDYGPGKTIQSNDSQYLDLLQKYNILLKQYRELDLVQNIRDNFPRDISHHYEAERLPFLQKYLPNSIRILQERANRLNIPFNPVDITNTSEYSFGTSILEDYQRLKELAGLSQSKSDPRKKDKKPKKTKKVKKGGTSRKRTKRRN